MDTDQQFATYQSLEKKFFVWLNTPKGSALMAHEKQCIEQQMRSAFGNYAVFVGLNAWQCSKSPSPISRRICLNSSLQHPSDVVMDPHSLPLATHSVDLLVLQHALDLSQSPATLLEEAQRVIEPGGKLLITGFNPLSIWGILRFFRFKQGVPWQAGFQSKWWIKRELINHGFGDFKLIAIYNPALNIKTRPWLKTLLAPFANTYLLSAVKKQTRGHIMKTQWRNKLPKPKYAVTGVACELNQNKELESS